MKIRFDTYGRTPANMPAWAWHRDGETPIESVCRAVARKTGLHVVNAVKDVRDLKTGWQHYQITLGKPFKSPGAIQSWTIDAEFWVII